MICIILYLQYQSIGYIINDIKISGRHVAKKGRTNAHTFKNMTTTVSILNNNGVCKHSY